MKSIEPFQGSYGVISLPTGFTRGYSYLSPSGFIVLTMSEDQGAIAHCLLPIAY